MRDICEDIKERIRAIDSEIMPLKIRVKQLEAQRYTLCKVLRLESADAEVPTKQRAHMVPGSLAETAARAIRSAGDALHVKDIAESMGQASNKGLIRSIATQLAKYAKDGRLFIRTAPNTFGLLEEP